MGRDRRSNEGAIGGETRRRTAAGLRRDLDVAGRGGSDKVRSHRNRTSKTKRSRPAGPILYQRQLSAILVSKAAIPLPPNLGRSTSPPRGSAAAIRGRRCERQSFRQYS